MDLWTYFLSAHFSFLYVDSLIQCSFLHIREKTKNSGTVEERLSHLMFFFFLKY